MVKYMWAPAEQQSPDPPLPLVRYARCKAQVLSGHCPCQGLTLFLSLAQANAESLVGGCGWASLRDRRRMEDPSFCICFTQEGLYGSDEGYFAC